jgi:hypothetical protein
VDWVFFQKSLNVFWAPRISALQVNFTFFDEKPEPEK